MRSLTAISSLLFGLIFAFPAYAAFVGPQIIIEGNCGKGDVDFGCQAADSDDSAIFILRVDELGNIIIGDGANLRIKIYDSNCLWMRNFSYKGVSLVGNWPQNLRAKANVGIFSLYEKLQKYDYYGNLVFSIQVPGAMDYWIIEGGIIWLQETKDKFIKYTSNGDLLMTVTDRPVELGIITEKKIAPGQYKVTVKYPDKTWEILRNTSSPVRKYLRDMNGNLYGLVKNFLVRYDDQGNEAAKLVMPQGRFQGTELPSDLPSDVELPRPEILEAYGPPVLAPNGDVYTWKRTPDKYYIIKWKWQ